MIDDWLNMALLIAAAACGLAAFLCVLLDEEEET